MVKFYYEECWEVVKVVLIKVCSYSCVVYGNDIFVYVILCIDLNCDNFLLYLLEVEKV